MGDYTEIKDSKSATELARLLQDKSRDFPVAVITIAAGENQPWIDIDDVVSQAGDLVQVYLMPTNEISWAFAKAMPVDGEVYGGAGRVYPVGTAWRDDLSLAPRRFAFNAGDGKQATQEIISDALKIAVAEGLLLTRLVDQFEHVSGIVKRVIAGRAMVEIGQGIFATIAEELTLPDVSIEQMFTEGQEVCGLFDPETKRLDVTGSLRSADEALEIYAEGDVVFAKVVMVRNGKAELMLYPKTSTDAVVVPVLRNAVTSNELDDLRTLMTVNEVVAARIVSTAPNWELTLIDIEDDDQIYEAPALFDGGPAWLEEEPLDHVEYIDEPELAVTTDFDYLADFPVIDDSEFEPGVPARPTPSMLDKNKNNGAPLPPPLQLAESSTVKDMSLNIDALRSQVTGLKKENKDLQEKFYAAQRAQIQLSNMLGTAEKRIEHLEQSLRTTKTNLRKQSSSKAVAPNTPKPRFADSEEGFRYLVLTQWATRTLPDEQSDRKLGDYSFGPSFFESLEKLEGISIEKVADVVFEIVTGLAPKIPGREVHQLRGDAGGDTAARSRSDGATAWRASLQVKTPSARRIHYWILSDGSFELSRVGTHDEFETQMLSVQSKPRESTSFVGLFRFYSLIRDLLFDQVLLFPLFTLIGHSQCFRHSSMLNLLSPPNDNQNKEGQDVWHHAEKVGTDLHPGCLKLEVQTI